MRAPCGIMAEEGRCWSYRLRTSFAPVLMIVEHNSSRSFTRSPTPVDATPGRGGLRPSGGGAACPGAPPDDVATPLPLARVPLGQAKPHPNDPLLAPAARHGQAGTGLLAHALACHLSDDQIGRASCRERV